MVTVSATVTAAEHPAKRRAELGGGHIVEDRIDRRVDVEHDPTKVKDIVEAVNSQNGLVLLRHHNDPKEEHADREKAEEIEKDYSGHHHNYLPTCPCLWVLLLVGKIRGVDEEAAGNDCVQQHQHHHGHEEKEDVRCNHEGDSHGRGQRLQTLVL